MAAFRNTHLKYKIYFLPKSEAKTDIEVPRPLTYSHRTGLDA